MLTLSVALVSGLPGSGFTVGFLEVPGVAIWGGGVVFGCSWSGNLGGGVAFRCSWSGNLGVGGSRLHFTGWHTCWTSHCFHCLSTSQIILFRYILQETSGVCEL